MEKKINIKAKKEIIFIFLSVFFISLVYALPPIPPLPDHFLGNVTINGQNAPVGTEIKVYVNNNLEDTVTINIVGKYDLYVKTGGTGDIIEFKVQDKLAGDSTRQGGETINLDLSLTTTTTTPPSGGSSGSSGGGGGGGGGGSSGGSSSYSTSPQDTTPKNNSNFTELNLEENKEAQGVNLGITGGAIGSLGSGKGIIAIIFIIVLGIGVMLIKFKPRKWTKRFSH